MLTDLQGLSVPMPKRSMFHGREKSTTRTKRGNGTKRFGKPVGKPQNRLHIWLISHIELLVYRTIFKQ